MDKRRICEDVVEYVDLLYPDAVVMHVVYAVHMALDMAEEACEYRISQSLGEEDA